MFNEILNKFIFTVLSSGIIKATLFVLLLFSSYCANAQLALRIGLDRKSYLVNEPVYAKINIRNYSGQGLVFGKNTVLNGKIQFEIHAPDGTIIKQYNSKLNPMQGTILNPGASANVIVPVSRLYHINKAGNYTIKAVLSHPRLTKSYESKTTGFSVFNGIIVWKRIVGVPDVLNTDTKSKIKTRTVKILSFYDEKNKLFALTIMDPKYIYGVARLANDIGNKLRFKTTPRTF